LFSPHNNKSSAAHQTKTIYQRLISLIPQKRHQNKKRSQKISPPKNGQLSHPQSVRTDSLAPRHFKNGSRRGAVNVWAHPQRGTGVVVFFCGVASRSLLLLSSLSGGACVDVVARVFVVAKVGARVLSLKPTSSPGVVVALLFAFLRAHTPAAAPSQHRKTVHRRQQGAVHRGV
jgi:hypothetical protein